MGKYLKSNQVISGREGEILVNIDGNVISAVEIKKLTCIAEKQKSEFKVIGYRNTQNKATGLKCIGSLTMYYGVSMWTKIMEKYSKTGVDTSFSIVVTNEDPSTDLGAQRIRLNGVNMNSLVIAQVDAETEFLTQDVDFTYDDFDVLDEFNTIVV